MSLVLKPLDWKKPRCGPDEYKTIARVEGFGIRYEIEHRGEGYEMPFTVTRSYEIHPFAWAYDLAGAQDEAQKDLHNTIMALVLSVGEPITNNLRAAFNNAFITATSGGDQKPHIKAVFTDLESMQSAHIALCAALGEPKPETIVRAANKHRGVVYDVPAPGRHHHVIRMLCSIGLASTSDPVTDEGGFITSTGRYVDRQEAWKIAEAAGQLNERAPTDKRGGTLYSEDVW